MPRYVYYVSGQVFAQDPKAMVSFVSLRSIPKSYEIEFESLAIFY